MKNVMEGGADDDSSGFLYWMKFLTSTLAETSSADLDCINVARGMQQSQIQQRWCDSWGVEFDQYLVAFFDLTQLVGLLLQGGEFHVGGVLLCSGHNKLSLVELARFGLPNVEQTLHGPFHLITHSANIAPPSVNLGCTRARSSTPRPHRTVQAAVRPLQTRLFPMPIKLLRSKKNTILY